ncbi:MAG: phenylalanine--tRNA ligase subunit beta [Candidatus Saccharibacteria bacterium]|nr:phenylalanine--tRNA ligase subunit beta [Candidatus Saccharibacteria bacterium]
MKISLNWIKKYVDVPVESAELIRLIGARLVEVEGVIDESKKYDKILVAKVVSAEKIPDTHLTLCQINVGGQKLDKVEYNEDGLVQVVCGAPNVREGMLAAWIAPGAVVPASAHEDQPFVIGKRKMLGKYESFGMLAGADELDFGEDHSGIVEIDPEMAEPGDLLKDVFELDDLILEIENKSLTHRPDTFGIIGFSREVAGILGKSFGYEYKDVNLKPTNDISVTIKDAGISERYTAVVLEKHGELKHKYLSLMDTLLSKSGMKPINPIVDVTNYLMLLTGQPLHAFDYDKFVQVGGSEKPEIVVRLAREGEKLVLLDDTEVVLNSDDIVICSGDTPVALAGAMGGKSTMIDENTRNIIIESATFSLYNMRKTQMAHGIFSEAITRFTKGQPPYQCLMVAEAAAEMLNDGFRVSAVADSLKGAETPIKVKVYSEEINKLLGTAYDDKLISRTLENVGFKVDNNKHLMTVTVPLWRTDIHIKEDVTEEIGRLLGYENIEPVLPLHGTASPNLTLSEKTRVRKIMSEFGANEVLTYSFVSGRLLEKAGLDTKESYKIVNSISPELQYIRQSIVPSLLDKAYLNQKVPIDQFAIFEINKVYQKSKGLDIENVPDEKMNLGMVLAERKNDGTPFYKAKLYAEELFKKLGIEVLFRPLGELTSDKLVEVLPFEKKRSAVIMLNVKNTEGDLADSSRAVLGIVGEFKNSVKRAFKLGDYLAGFELNFDELKMQAEAARLKQKIDVRPVVDKRDLTVQTTKSYAEIYDAVSEITDSYDNAAIITPLAIYQPENIKHISFHLEFKKKVDEKMMQELETIA